VNLKASKGAAAQGRERQGAQAAAHPLPGYLTRKQQRGGRTPSVHAITRAVIRGV